MIYDLNPDDMSSFHSSDDSEDSVSLSEEERLEQVTDDVNIFHDSSADSDEEAQQWLEEVPDEDFFQDEFHGELSEEARQWLWNYPH